MIFRVSTVLYRSETESSILPLAFFIRSWLFCMSRSDKFKMELSGVIYSWETVAVIACWYATFALLCSPCIMLSMLPILIIKLSFWLNLTL